MKFCKWLAAIIAVLWLTGCAGLQFDYVREGTQVETRGLTPALTARIMQAATPVVKRGCPQGVRSDERSFRAERIPADPTVYGSQYRDAADAALRIECVVVNPQARR